MAIEVPVGKKIVCRSPVTYDFFTSTVVNSGVAVPALVETSTAIHLPMSLRYETRRSRRTSRFTRRRQLGTLWLVAAISGFVLIEPAPYEFMIILTALIFLATGLRGRARPLPLMAVLVFL